MNSEHKKLIDLMNKVYDLHEAKASQDQMVPVLMNLVNYTIEHFKHEEEHMEAIDFPETELHKRVHADLLRRLGEYDEAKIVQEQTAAETTAR